MVNSYKMLEHPADIGFEAKGKDMAAALEEASKALYDIVVNPENIESSEIMEISITAIDEEAAIIKWLNEIVFLLDAESFIGKEIEVKVTSKTGEEISLSGKIYGERYRSDKHNFKVHVKAVTHHQFELIKNEDGTTIRVFLDI